MSSSTSRPPGQEDPERSSELLRRAQTGDRAAFDALIRRSQPRLMKLVRRRLGAELRGVEESADVVQSALAVAVRDLQSFEYRGEGSFLRWLSTIVENKIRHHARDLGREKRDPDRVQPLEPRDQSSTAGKTPPAARQPTPSQVAMGREMEQRYQQALNDMPPSERELLLLHLELGCSHGEIAQALGIISEEAVRKRVARALARLEQMIHSKS